LDSAGGDVERLREEKDQEIMILQESMDSTIQKLIDAQQVSGPVAVNTRTFLMANFRIKAFQKKLLMLRSTL